MKRFIKTMAIPMLALVMAFLMNAVSSYADGSSTFSAAVHVKTAQEFDEAIDTANRSTDSQMIVLDNDITITKTIEVKRSTKAKLVLDLNGKTLSIEEVSKGFILSDNTDFSVINSAFKDGRDDTVGTISFLGSGTCYEGGSAFLPLFKIENKNVSLSLLGTQYTSKEDWKFAERAKDGIKIEIKSPEISYADPSAIFVAPLAGNNLINIFGTKIISCGCILHVPDGTTLDHVEIALANRSILQTEKNSPLKIDNPDKVYIRLYEVTFAISEAGKPIVEKKEGKSESAKLGESIKLPNDDSFRYNSHTIETAQYVGVKNTALSSLPMNYAVYSEQNGSTTTYTYGAVIGSTYTERYEASKPYLYTEYGHYVTDVHTNNFGYGRVYVDPHTYDAGVIVKQPTYTETGLKKYTCTCEACKYVKEEILPILEKPKPEPPKPQPPKVGYKGTDSKNGYKYKVTKTGSKGGEALVTGVAKSSTKKVTIPDSIQINGFTYKLTAVNDKAFYKKTKLTTVTIGKNVKKIGKSAFYGCKNLKTLNIKTTKLKSSTVGKKAFSGTYKKIVVNVPKKSYSAYKKFLFKAGIKETGKIKKKY